MCFLISLDEKAVCCLRELQVKLDDFERVKLIGRGAFGAVQLVSECVSESCVGVCLHECLPLLFAVCFQA